MFSAVKFLSAKRRANTFALQLQRSSGARATRIPKRCVLKNCSRDFHVESKLSLIPETIMKQIMRISR